MCGRYTLAGPDPSVLRGRFPLGESVEVRQRFNVAPGDDVLAVTAGRDGETRGELLRWGLVPHWASSPAFGLKLINARAETVATKPAFRDSFERRRCLVLADGWYEWERLPGYKQPHWITRADHAPFAFAAVRATWRAAEDGPVLRSCAIVTAPSNQSLRRIHDRMPVVLPRGAEEAWLDAGTDPHELLPLLAALPDSETTALPVGGAVNDARYDGPECIVPAELPLSLFDA